MRYINTITKCKLTYIKARIAFTRMQSIRCVRCQIIMAERDFFLFPIMQAGYIGKHFFFTIKNLGLIGVKILYGTGQRDGIKLKAGSEIRKT